ncbi:MAG TPA: type 4a pilus biogenesis protein PilO [Actinomycetota bacterium]|nr:type 4a pilus biogenesis protein PilO [Actinomycetota bacterium]
MSRRAPIIAGAVSAVLVVLAVVFMVLPKMSAVSEKKEEVVQAQAEEEQLLVQLRALQDAQAQAPQTRRQISAVENKVPPVADLPGLIRLLRDAADRATVDLFQFSPNAPVLDPTGQFSTISTAVNVTGSYFSVDAFLFRLETLTRAAKVTNVSISPQGAGEGLASDTLSMQLTVEFYTSDLSAGPGSEPEPSS